LLSILSVAVSLFLVVTLLVALRELTLPAEGAGEISLYDVRGRRVRVLARGGFAAGDQSLSWDGRDTTGRRVAPGVYFALVRVGALTMTGHVLRLE